MEKRELASLIEALCEAPLDGRAESSAELLALRREAAKALVEATGTDAAAEMSADRLIAALAALLSGSDSEAARLALADRATRLDAESALAFVDAVELSAQAAPAHLVEELVAAEARAPRGGATARSVWSGVAEGFRPAQRWRVVGACAVMLVASAAALSLYWEETGQLANPPASVAKRANPESGPAVAAGAPAARSPVLAPSAVLTPPPAVSPPILAESQPCEPSSRISASAAKESRSLARAQKTPIDSDDACNSAPGNRLVDTALKEALEKAERARAAADAAAKIGTMKTDRESVQADRLDRMPGVAAERPAAAAGSAPAALPAKPSAGR
ncbi:MAG: hypothetical protein HY852_04010 [Bradyrhizobium sp.]|uniref:hypothetical protein n=1 Tax=Bradyrhizobium sp. TaxID=376 RepID=UPI0025B86BA0|nr:hypothetical protein [Bradyrhizobium sp.]MBI5260967.1 hypothetical protein [Bradyrhizobium sp.]